MSHISPIGVRESLEYVFGKDFDACNVIHIRQNNEAVDQGPHYIVKNTSKDLKIEIKTMKVSLSPRECIDLVSHPSFRSKKITAVENFVAENEELRILSAAGLIQINENIFKSKIYDKNYFITVFQWKGKLVEEKRYSDLNADQVGMSALRAYMRMPKDHRCISCLQYPHNLVQYFFEKFPSEIDEFRKDGMIGYEKFINIYMRDFESADSKLAIDAEIKDKANGILNKAI